MKQKTLHGGRRRLPVDQEMILGAIASLKERAAANVDDILSYMIGDYQWTQENITRNLNVLYEEGFLGRCRDGNEYFVTNKSRHYLTYLKFSGVLLP